jgi:N-acetyl sugar amidotransferase
MKYCKRCLYPENHPLNITFDNEGICSGCRIHEEKFSLDWRDREKKLIDILEAYRSPTGNNYDCIIPVTGARDSYYIVHLIKNVYGMNPLLVMYNKHYNTRRGLRNFANLKIKFNCDAITMVCDPAKLKKITRVTLKKMGSLYWHVIAGNTVFPVQSAVRHKIPLIIWGAHQGLDQVGMFSHTDEVEMTRKYRKEHDLMGFEAEDLLNESDLTEKDLIQFFYPHDKELEKIGVRGIYLGNYIPWDSKKQHELMIKLYNYETAPQRRTFDTYNDVDCLHYSGLHDYIKFIKHGYGKVTDHASREIRWGRLTRDEGIQLVKSYQDQMPYDIQNFLDWIGQSGESLMKTINEFRSQKAWEQIFNTEWRLKDPIAHYLNEKIPQGIAMNKTDSCDFIVTPSREPSANEREAVLLTKGFVEI